MSNFRGSDFLRRRVTKGGEQSVEIALCHLWMAPYHGVDLSLEALICLCIIAFFLKTPYVIQKFLVHIHIWHVEMYCLHQILLRKQVFPKSFLRFVDQFWRQFTASGAKHEF